MSAVVTVLLCVALNALLSSAEMAFVAANRSAVRAAAKGGDARAAALASLQRNPERTFSVIQIGITLLGALAGAEGGARADEVIGPWLERRFGFGEGAAEALAIAFVVVPITFVSVVLGELVPKALALRNPLGIARGAAPFLVIAQTVLTPFVLVLDGTTKLILRLLFPRHRRAAEGEEDRTVDLTPLSEAHQSYVLNLVGLGERRVRDVALPWNHVLRFDAGERVEDVERRWLLAGHTRAPVVRGDRVLGIVNAKEFWALRKAGRADWTTLLRDAVSAAPDELLLPVLRRLQKERQGMALVLEDGVPRGIVTLEDVFEEIVGDIYDEYDAGALLRILGSGVRRQAHRGAGG